MDKVTKRRPRRRWHHCEPYEPSDQLAGQGPEEELKALELSAEEAVNQKLAAEEELKPLWGLLTRAIEFYRSLGSGRQNKARMAAMWLAEYTMRFGSPSTAEETIPDLGQIADFALMADVLTTEQRRDLELIRKLGLEHEGGDYE
jgi:hypothetical protein